MKAKARRWDEKAVDKLKEKKEKLTDELKVIHCLNQAARNLNPTDFTGARNIFLLSICFVGANEGQEEGGRVASGSVSSPRSSDETQVLAE